MSINSGDNPWPQVLSHPDLDWPTDEPRVLVPFHEAVNLTETGLLGASITFGTDGELYLLHAVDADDNEIPDRILDEAELKMEIRDRFPVPVHQTEQEYSPNLLDTFTSSNAITTTVVDREETSFFARDRDERTVAKGCHTVVGTGMDTFESPSSILVPVAKGPHSGLASRIAEAIARSYDCWIELFHVIPEEASEHVEVDAEGLLEAYEYQLDDDVTVDHHVVRAAEPAEAIIEHSGYHNLTVLGAPEKGKLRRFLFGSTTDKVTENAKPGPVLTAHRNMDDSVISRWF